MTNALTKAPVRKLTLKQTKQLLAYTDPGAILSALDKSDWTVEKAIQNMADIANNCEKDSTKLAANKFLWQLILEAMERSGMLVIATKESYGEDGDKITFTGQVVESILRDQREAPQTTLQDLTGDDYPELEESENVEKKQKSKRTRKNTGGIDGPVSERARKSPTRGNTSGDRRTTSGLSDDLHSSKHPEGYSDSFKGIAVQTGLTDRDEYKGISR